MSEESVYTDDSYSVEEALALLLDCRLSKEDYQTLRSGASSKGSKLYPAYNKVREEKQKCIPNGGIKVTDYKAEVGLQELLEHTAKRILLSKQISLIEGDELPKTDLTLICKIGYDGSTGQSVYKQNSSNDSELADISSEESLFLTCLVPLQIKSDVSGDIIWQNDRPSSTLFCRPVRFSYTKENRDTIRAETVFINDFDPQTFYLGQYAISFKLEETMLDGKVATVLSNMTDSNQSCSICGLTSSNMNKLDTVFKHSEAVPEENFR